MRISLVGLALILFGQDQRLPVPNAADQKKAESEIRAVFKEDFARKTREGKRALAQKLLREAGDEKNTPSSRYVVLLLSRELAVESVELAALFFAIDQLAKLYNLEKPSLTGATFVSSGNALKILGLNSAQKFATTQEDSSSLAEAYLRVAEDALKERIFDDVLSAAQAAERYAKSAKAAAVVERAGQITKEVPDLKKEDESFANVITTKADDPAAKLIKGRYSLFVVGDEASGIENLLGCSDEGLKNVAKLETMKPSTAESILQLAEAWVALSNKEESLLHKRRYQNRARFWFEEAMRSAGGITKAKIEKRLEEIGGKRGNGPMVDLIQLIDIKKDSPEGLWERNATTLDTPKTGLATLNFPFVAPTEFDLIMTVEKRSSNVLDVSLGVGDIIMAFDNEDANSGIRLGSRVIASCGAVISKNKPTQLTLSVRLTGLSAKVDGKVVLDWKGDYTKQGDVPAKPPNPIVLKTTGGWRIPKLAIQQLSGQGKRLR